MPEPRGSDHYGQYDRSPELKPGDLQRGLGWLRTEAERGSPSARAVLAELERLKAENAALRRRKGRS
jgi:hypothetical protein